MASNMAIWWWDGYLTEFGWVSKNVARYVKWRLLNVNPDESSGELRYTPLPEE